jgi:hypothetical protein
MISAPSFARASSKSDVNLNFEAFNKPAIIQIEKNPPKPNFEMISYQIKK